MKSTVSLKLSAPELEVLNDLCTITGQSPAEFARTAINSSFYVMVEDGKSLPRQHSAIGYWKKFGEKLARGGQSEPVKDRSFRKHPKYRWAMRKIAALRKAA